MSYILGIDVGGTFTDFLEIDASGSVEIVKTASTPLRPADGVLAGLAKLASLHESPLAQYLSRVGLIVHGTTITTNAVITRNFAKTGYLTTKGFRDILNSRRGIKRNAFTAKEAPPTPIVPQYLVRTVEERVDRDGTVVTPLGEYDVRSAAHYFRELGVEAVAVNYMFSFLNARHEKRTREILGEELPGVFVTISSDVLPQVRFYERGSTTVFNACVGPLLRAYISDLQRQLGDSGFRGRFLTMQSNGGVMSLEVVKEFAANTLLSGPASGPVAANFFARRHKLANLISIDMGGTSLDVCLVRDGRVGISNRSEVAEYALALPSIDIHAIGAGGGSIASVDSGGILCVGPESAGAAPGPAAYGAGGTRPTVTDANLVLGYINPDYFLGGEQRLNLELAAGAIERDVARPMKLDLEEAARGIVAVVNAQMANGVRQVSVARGFDPRDAALVAAGGAGPLHACGIAEELGLELILVPRTSSVLCSTGMLATDLRHDFVRFASIRLDEPERAAAGLNKIRGELIERGRKILDDEGVAAGRRRFEFSCDMQFEGQFNVLETSVPLLAAGPLRVKDLAAVARSFVEHHERVYGYTLHDSTIEIQSIRMSAIGVTDPPPFREIARGARSATAALKGHRRAWFSGRSVKTPIYESGLLRAGNEIAGPAIIEAPTTTIKIDPQWNLKVDPIGSYLMWKKGATLSRTLARLSERKRLDGPQRRKKVRSGERSRTSVA
jgi:N-methylhydantoinase A